MPLLLTAIGTTKSPLSVITTKSFFLTTERNQSSPAFFPSIDRHRLHRLREDAGVCAASHHGGAAGGDDGADRAWGGPLRDDHLPITGAGQADI